MSIRRQFNANEFFQKMTVTSLVFTGAYLGLASEVEKPTKHITVNI